MNKRNCPNVKCNVEIADTEVECPSCRVDIKFLDKQINDAELVQLAIEEKRKKSAPVTQPTIQPTKKRKRLFER
jgi:hypothetical protein